MSLLCGCSTIRQMIHPQEKSNARAEQLQILQLRGMRFADEYVASITGPIRRFEASTDNSADRLAAQSWLLSQATAAYTIASGVSPVVNTVDMVVLATLSRMVIDDAWSGERFGERAAPLRDAYHRLEPLAVQLAQDALSADQIAELQRAINAWRAKNPHATDIAYVHFRDVAGSLGQPTSGRSGSSNGLFTLLGIDPFSSLDPAVREISQTRQLAERTIYYAQHVPSLLDMQVERLTFEIATMPETKQVLADASQVAGAANTTGRVIGDLPNLLAGEREAAIRQFMQAIAVETSDIRSLVIEMRAALETGTATSNSLNTTIQSFDRLVAGFEKPKSGAASAQAPGRPFDITEYTAAAAEITRAANELQVLITGVDRGSPALMDAAEHATAALQKVVDHAYWRMVQLIALLFVGGLAVALAYRGVARRWLA
jgi:hypothetical protein